MRALAAAFIVCTACTAHARAHGRPPNFPVTAEQRAQLTADTLELLDQHYVFPERLPTVLPALKTRWSAADFAKLDNAWAVVDHMNADFKEVVHDGHLFMRLAAGFPPQAFGDPDAQPSASELAEIEAEDRKTNFGVEKSEVLDGNVGYLRIRGFAMKTRAQQDAYAKALQPLFGTRALIIDLRDNHGGDGDAVADLVGYLIDHKALLQYDVTRAGKATEHVSLPKEQQYRSPVYVLTSGETFSAAEECAYDLQTQKRATIVGEHTGGGANHNRFFKVAGAFALSVPYMTTKNAVTGTNWEGAGVQPDVQVAAADALEKARQLATH